MKCGLAWSRGIAAWGEFQPESMAGSKHRGDACPVPAMARSRALDVVFPCGRLGCCGSLTCAGVGRRLWHRQSHKNQLHNHYFFYYLVSSAEATCKRMKGG